MSGGDLGSLLSNHVAAFRSALLITKKKQNAAVSTTYEYLEA